MLTSEKTKKKDSLTLADLIMTVAFGFFAVYYYTGSSIKYGVNSAIIYVLLVIVGLFLILSGLKKVKQVNEDFSKWKKVEILLLIAFIGIFIFASKPVVKGLSVSIEKGNLIKTCMTDISNVKSLFASYSKNERNAIELIRESFRSVSSNNKQIKDEEVKEYIRKTVTGTDFNGYCDGLEAKYLGASGEGDNNYQAFIRKSLSDLANDSVKIKEWNIVELAGVAERLDKNNITIAERLTAISKQRHPDHAEVPYKYIIKNDNGRYIIDKEKTESLEYVYHKKELKFFNELENAKSPIAVVVVIVLFVMMLTGYLTAQRSTTVDIINSSKNSDFDDGGISLY